MILHGSPSRLGTPAALLMILLGGSLAGCGSSTVMAPLGRAPQTGKPPPTRSHLPPRDASIHEVRSGETLYTIAWRYSRDFRDLARLNSIPAPYTIYPGQRLRLTSSAPDQATTSGVARAPRAARSTAAARSAPHPSAESTRPAPRRQAEQRVAKWSWPTVGRVIGRFGSDGGKGIDIEGRLGQTIVAAAPGKVVYSGSGLRGYGKLIIIKHNDRYLSAYAHNRRLHVKEGESVQLGQRIAEMGRSDAKRVMLHFEIRRDGKPVDPARHLPG